MKSPWLLLSLFPFVAGAVFLSRTTAVGEIESPHYPATYPPNYRVRWDLADRRHLLSVSLLARPST